MTGAAGGLAGGLWAAFGAVLEPGAPFVLDALDYDARMRAAARGDRRRGPARPDETLRGQGASARPRTRARQAGVPLLRDRRHERARPVRRADPRPAARARGADARRARGRRGEPSAADLAERRGLRPTRLARRVRRVPARPAPLAARPRARRAVVIGAGSFGTAVAVLLARGGFRTTLQTRTRRAGRAAERRPREPGLPARRRAAARAADRADRRRARARRLRVPRRPLARARRGHRRPAGRRARRTAPRSSRWPRASCRPTAPRRPSLLARALRRRPRRVHRRPRPRARDGHEGAGLVAAVDRRAARGDARRRLHPRRRRLRAVRTTRSASSSPARPKNAAALAAGATEAQGLNAAGAAAGPHLRRGLALRRAPGRAAGVDDRPGRDRRPRRHRAGAAEPQPARGRAARRRASRRAEIPERIGQAVEALESVPLLARGARPRRRSTRRSPTALRAPDLGRAAARRLGRARAHDRPAAGAPPRRRPRSARVLAASVGALDAGVPKGVDVAPWSGWGLLWCFSRSAPAPPWALSRLRSRAPR